MKVGSYLLPSLLDRPEVQIPVNSIEILSVLAQETLESHVFL